MSDRHAAPAAGRKVPQLLGPATGGIRTHVRCLAAGLTDLGIAAPILAPKGVVPPDETGGTVDVPAGASPLGWWRARRQARPWCVGADVVHAHGIKAAAVAAPGRSGPPMVMTLHNVVLAEPSGRIPAWRAQLAERSIGRAARIIVPAAWMVDEVPTRLRSRVRVVVPAAPLPVIARDRDEVRAGWGIGAETPVAVCVARLHPQKGLTTLLASWRAVRSIIPDAELVIVGDGPQRAELERELADAPGGARLVGASDAAVECMAAADVVVISSVWEALPLVLIESLRVGTPVISTDVGVARELLTDDRLGEVVRVGDRDALAAALVGRLKEPTGSGGELGLGDLAARLAPDHLIEQVVDVYRELW